MFALFQEAFDQQNLAAKGIRLAASIAKRMMQFGGFKASLDLPAFASLEQNGFLQPAWKRFSSRTLVSFRRHKWRDQFGAGNNALVRSLTQ